jgi:hypothetical protein
MGPDVWVHVDVRGEQQECAAAIPWLEKRCVRDGEKQYLDTVPLGGPGLLFLERDIFRYRDGTFSP